MKFAQRLVGSGGLGKGSLQAMAIRAVGLGLGFGSHILLSRLLGAEAYGRYSIVLGWALIFVIPTRMGLDTSAYKYAAHYREEADSGRLAAFQRYALGVMSVGTLVWAGLGIAVVLMMATAERKAVAWPEVTAFAAMLFPLAVIGLFSVLLRVAGRIAESQIYEQVLRPALLSAGIIALAWSGGGIDLDQALAVTVVSLWLVLAAITIHSLRVQPISGGRSDAADRRTWLRTGSTLLVISAIQELMNQVDIILLGWAGQAHTAALFAAGARLATLITFGLIAVGMIAAPPIAIAFRQGDQQALARIARQAAWISTGFALIVALLVNLAAPLLLGLFGPDFANATTALAILTVGYIVNAATGVVAYLLSMTGHEKRLLRIVAMALTANVVLNLLLVPRFGVDGAAVAAAVGLTLLNVTTAFSAKRLIGINGTIFARGTD